MYLSVCFYECIFEVYVYFSVCVLQVVSSYCTVHSGENVCNSGNCSDESNGQYSCNCPADYTGQNCEVSLFSVVCRPTFIMSKSPVVQYFTDQCVLATESSLLYTLSIWSLGKLQLQIFPIGYLPSTIRVDTE